MIITVCIGSSCHLKGSYDIVQMLQKLISEHGLETKVEIKASFCLGDCKNGVCVKVNEGPIISVNKENLNEFFNDYIVKNM